MTRHATLLWYNNYKNAPPTLTTPSHKTSNIPRRTTLSTLSDNYIVEIPVLFLIVIFYSPQVAVIAGNLELAEVIQSHKEEDVGKN